MKYLVKYLSNNTHIDQTVHFKRQLIYKGEQVDRIREELRMKVMELTISDIRYASYTVAKLIQIPFK